MGIVTGLKDILAKVLNRLPKNVSIEPYDPRKDKLVLRWTEIAGVVTETKLYFQNPARKYNTTNPLNVNILNANCIDPVIGFAKSLEILSNLITREACVRCVSTGAKSVGKDIDACPEVRYFKADYDYMTFMGAYLIEAVYELGQEGVPACHIKLKLLTGMYECDPEIGFCLPMGDPDLPIIEQALYGVVSAKRNINRSCGLPKSSDQQE